MARLREVTATAAIVCGAVYLSIRLGVIPTLAILGMLLIGMLGKWIAPWLVTGLMVAAPGVLVVLWHPGLLRGREVPPIRTTLLTIACAAAQIPWFATQWSDGLEHHGLTYCLTLLALNVAATLAVGFLHWRARSRPSFRRNLALHAALFAWMIGLAFPLLEEFFI